MENTLKWKVIKSSQQKEIAIQSFHYGILIEICIS